MPFAKWSRTLGQKWGKGKRGRGGPEKRFVWQCIGKPTLQSATLGRTPPASEPSAARGWTKRARVDIVLDR